MTTTEHPATQDLPLDAPLGGPVLESSVRSAMAPYRARARADVDALVRPHVAQAEMARRFPRAVLQDLGARGHFVERWAGPGPYGDIGRSMALARELGRVMAGGISAAVSLHADSALGLMRAAGMRETGLFSDAAHGRTLLCIGVTEPTGGSDLTGLHTTASRRPDGSWVITGRKKFISLSGTADAALVLARTGDGPMHLSFFVVPRGGDGYVVLRELAKHGTLSVETCELDLDEAVVPAGAIVGREGAGLALFSRAMTAERLALCAQLVGALEAAVEIVRGHLRARATKDGRLWDFQALRHRFADLAAELVVMDAALLQVASDVQMGSATHRQVAALKLYLAPRVERALSEALQMLGGAGYIDEFPIERGLRDVRLARIGAGTDDVMRELVAEIGVSPDAYDQWMAERDGDAP